jgi:hypothetical protein
MEKRTNINAMVTERALALLSSNNIDLDESLLDPKQTKNVCAKLSVELSDRIDSLVGLLGVSKRLWLESAILDALEQSSRILEQEGVFDMLDAISKASAEFKAKQEAAE